MKLNQSISLLEIDKKNDQRDSFNSSLKKSKKKISKRTSYIIIILMFFLSFFFFLFLCYSLVKYILNIKKKNKELLNEINTLITQKEINDDMIQEMTHQAKSSENIIKLLNEKNNEFIAAKTTLNEVNVVNEDKIKGLLIQLDSIKLANDKQINELNNKEQLINELKLKLIQTEKAIDDKDNEIQNYKKLSGGNNDSKLSILKLERDLKGYHERIKELEENESSLRTTNTILLNKFTKEEEDKLNLNETINKMLYIVKRNADWGCNDNSTKNIRATIEDFKNKIKSWL